MDYDQIKCNLEQYLDLTRRQSVCVTVLDRIETFELVMRQQLNIGTMYWQVIPVAGI